MLLHTKFGAPYTKKLAESYLKRYTSTTPPSPDTITISIPKFSNLTDTQKKAAKVYLTLVTLSWAMKIYDDGKEKLLQTIADDRHQLPSMWQEWKAVHDGCGEKPVLNLIASAAFPIYCITHTVSKLVYMTHAKNGLFNQFF